VDTIEPEVKGGRRRRRRHSEQFKSQVIAACQLPGVSIASVALSNGVNANLVRRWVAECERRLPAPKQPDSAAGGNGKPAFVPLQVNQEADSAVRIELRRGAMTVHVVWPASASAACAAWLRELLR
jgi:transposase